jgi:hypothetical protein
MEKHERYLTKRDKKILDFITRYRIGTNALLRDACFEADIGLKNVDRVLLRLERRKLLRRTKLDAGQSYYTMTRRGLALKDENAKTPPPLTEQTLPVVLATASYCVSNGLYRFTRDEFVERYPDFTRPGICSSNYALRKTEDGFTLELLVTDRGGAAHRIRSRVRRFVWQRKDMAQFASLMRDGKFRITVLTATPEQRWKILRRIGDSFRPIEVAAVVIPELADLLMLRKK